MRRIVVTVVLLILPFFTTPFTAITSASLEGTPIRPAWIKAGDYVTHLYTVTALGISETIHMKFIIMDDSGIYLNRMRIERFGEQNDPDFPLSHLQPSVEEAGPNGVAYDPTFLISEDELTSYQPELEEVRGLNNITYEAYKVLQPEVWVFGELCECNRTYWFEKETLVKIKQLNWWRQEGMDVWSERLIEESNIPLLTNQSQSTTLAKTVTTTIFVSPPQTTVTTTVTLTTTVTVSKTVKTTTLTNNVTNTTTEVITEPLIYTWATGVTTIAAIAAIMLIRKRRYEERRINKTIKTDDCLH